MNKSQTFESILNGVHDLGQKLNELTDEIIRLRAFMPADVLREYDRRRAGEK